LWLHLQLHELDDKERHRIGNMGKLPHHSSGGMLFVKTDLVSLSAAPGNYCMNTITHCTVSKAFLLCRHLSWGNEETQIGKIKEERKPPLSKVLSYLDNTTHASLLLTPDGCGINPKEGTIA